MIERRSPFLAYRYMVTPISNQLTIHQEISKSKELLMKDIIMNLSSDTKTVFNRGFKRYLFYGSQNQDNLYIIKFARESSPIIYTEGENDIEVNEIKETKFVYLMIDTTNQIILMERNITVFQSVENAIKVLADFFRFKNLTMLLISIH